MISAGLPRRMFAAKMGIWVETARGLGSLKANQGEGGIFLGFFFPWEEVTPGSYCHAMLSLAQSEKIWGFGNPSLLTPSTTKAEN